MQLAMTYGNPSIASAVQSFAEQGVTKLIVLPLYPQYCSSTTGSVFDATHRALQRWRYCRRSASSTIIMTMRGISTL